MKARSQAWSRALIFTFIIMLAASTAAFAGGKDSVQLPYDTKVNSTVLPAGDYTLQWDDSGKVDFLKGKKIVASGTATVNKQSHPVRATNVSTGKAADGSRVLTEIEIAGKNVALSFSEAGGKGEVATAK